MDIVACVGAFAAGARECSAVVGFVWGRVFGEADVAVDAKYDVFYGEFGDGWVNVCDTGGECGNVGGEVGEGAAVFFIVR